MLYVLVVALVISAVAGKSPPPSRSSLRPPPKHLHTYSIILGQKKFTCPVKDGTFEDLRQCDKYYECYDGVAEERLCPDGLVFDPFSNRREPCDHYFNVDCGDRLELRK
jgi:hypothetical protein